jgi:hypothetical protein
MAPPSPRITLAMDCFMATGNNKGLKPAMHMVGRRDEIVNYILPT